MILPTFSELYLHTEYIHIQHKYTTYINHSNINLSFQYTGYKTSTRELGVNPRHPRYHCKISTMFSRMENSTLSRKCTRWSSSQFHVDMNNKKYKNNGHRHKRGVKKKGENKLCSWDQMRGIYQTEMTKPNQSPTGRLRGEREDRKRKWRCRGQ